MGQTGGMSSGAASGWMGASAGMSAMSAIGTAWSQANAMKAKGVYDQSVADTNAKIATLQSKQTLEAGDIMASRQNLKTQATVGAIRAQQGASGVDVASGSSALVRNSVQTVGAMDELTIRNNAARAAWGFQTQAIQDTYEGQFAHMTASNEAQQTLLSGGLQAVEGPTSIYANYLMRSTYHGMGGQPGQPFDLTTAPV